MDRVLIVWREILPDVLSFKTILDLKKFVLNGNAHDTNRVHAFLLAKSFINQNIVHVYCANISESF